MSLLHSGDELSLRHLPDVSDASFSFQIPGISTAENLLADDTDFFRGGADLSLETLESPRKVNDLLTLSQLTPRPPRNAISSKIFPTSSNSTRPKYEDVLNPLSSPKLTLIHQPNPRPSLISTAPGPSAAIHNQKLPGQEDLHSRKDSNRPESSESASTREDMPTIEQKPKSVANPTRETTQVQKREERRQKMTTRSKTRTAAVVPTVSKSRTTARESSEVQSRIDNPTVSSAISTSQLPETTARPHGDYIFAPDTSVQSVEAMDNVTERLLKFGQMFMSSSSGFPSDNPSVRSIPAIRDVQSECELPSVEAATDERDAQVGLEQETANNSDDGPLTISQLSPRKCSSPTPTPTPPDNVPVSPSRSSSKRPVADSSNNCQGREKRMKMDPTSAAQTASTSRQPQEQRPRTHSISRQPPKAALSRSDIASQTRVATRVLRTTRSVSATQPPIQTQSSTLKSNESKEKHPKPPRSAPVASTSTRTSSNNLRSQSSSLRHKPSSSLNERKQPRLLSEFKPAWIDPIDSQPATNASQHADRSDNKSQSQFDQPSRSLSRSSHSRSQRRYETVHPIPDFKALHAAHEASMANRKENIHPIKPIEIQWETEIRAKERQRFDEMVKEKEREQERLKEKQRQEREEQEAREIRELRMKAIPKANEVPEWYKDVPRKTNKGGSLDASGASSVRR